MKEIDDSKENVILINKADLLTAEQRGAWAAYFEKENVKIIFWSALAEAIQLIGDSEVTGGLFRVGFLGGGFQFLVSELWVCLFEVLWEFGGFVGSLNARVLGWSTQQENESQGCFLWLSNSLTSLGLFVTH